MNLISDFWLCGVRYYAKVSLFKLSRNHCNFDMASSKLNYIDDKIVIDVSHISFIFNYINLVHLNISPDR